MDDDLVPTRAILRVFNDDISLRPISPDGTTLDIDGTNYALRSEHPGALADDVGRLHSCRVDRDLVCPGEQDLADVLDRPDAAPDAKRDEHLLGSAPVRRPARCCARPTTP